MRPLAAGRWTTGSRGWGKPLQLHWCSPTLLLLLPHHPLLPTHSATWPVQDIIHIAIIVYPTKPVFG